MVQELGVVLVVWVTSIIVFGMAVSELSVTVFGRRVRSPVVRAFRERPRQRIDGRSGRSRSGAAWGIFFAAFSQFVPVVVILYGPDPAHQIRYAVAWLEIVVAAALAVVVVKGTQPDRP